MPGVLEADSPFSPPQAPDALDQVKKAFKGMFRNRKKPGDEHHESTHAYQATSTSPETQQRPTSTQPPAPVPLAPSAKEAATLAPVARQTSIDSNASEPAPAPGTAPVADPTAPTPASKTPGPLRPEPATVESTDDIDLPTKKTTSSAAAGTTVPPTTVTERVPGMSATSGPLEDNLEYTQ